MTPAKIAQIIEENKKYNKTNGKKGQRPDLRSANLRGADLCGADLRSANLRGADLCGADLLGANLCGANLRSANLRGADLCGADLLGANLRSANLRSANLRGADLCGADLLGANLRSAIDWQNSEWARQAKQQLRYILGYCHSEVAVLIEKIKSGGIDGSQYEGKCCCLIGSLGNDNAIAKIPDYEKGLHNYSEQLFWQIKKGDTPETSEFSKLALEVCMEFVNAMP
jgi:hypothetical protein